MKTTDSVMREFDEKFHKRVWEIVKKAQPSSYVAALSLGLLEGDGPQIYGEMKAFLSHSLAEARREEREQRDSAWKKIIACHNCSGTGRTDNIGGAMECIECGGQCHNLVRYDGIHIDYLLTGDNPERK